jgi:hypothetical protein
MKPDSREILNVLVVEAPLQDGGLTVLEDNTTTGDWMVLLYYEVSMV